MEPSKIHYIHSSKIAKQRLEHMHHNDEKEQSKNSTEQLKNGRILNTFPADNNQMWDSNHNPLSSKGD